MARSLSPEQKRDKRRLDYESMKLSFACRPGEMVKAWKAYENESTRLAGRPTTDGGLATLYVVDLNVRSLTGPGTYHSAWTVRIDMGGDLYPHTVSWPTVTSSLKPWGPHFSKSGSGQICNGNMWSANLTLAEYVIAILRIFNFDEDINRTDGGLNTDAKTYWRDQMKGKPIDPAIRYPVARIPDSSSSPPPPFGPIVVTHASKR